MGQVLPFTPLALRWPHAVEALDPAAALLLGHGVRVWVAAARRHGDPQAEARAALERQAIGPEAAMALHGLMHAIALCASRVVEIGCPGCPRLGADEARLLHAVAEAAHGAAGPATALGPFVTPAALPLLHPRAAGLAWLLGQAGCRFRRRALPGEAELATSPQWH